MFFHRVFSRNYSLALRNYLVDPITWLLIFYLLHNSSTLRRALGAAHFFSQSGICSIVSVTGVRFVCCGRCLKIIIEYLWNLVKVSIPCTVQAVRCCFLFINFVEGSAGFDGGWACTVFLCLVMDI